MVWITGAGVISSIGADVGETLDSLLNLRCGIGPARFLDTGLSQLPVGEVPYGNDSLAALAGVDAEHPRAVLLGIKAVKEAVASAGLEGGLQDVVFISGTTVGGMDVTERYYPNPSGKVYIKDHDCGAITDAIASLAGFAFRTTVSTACSASLNAIIMGCCLIEAGLADKVVAGGTECLTRYHLNGFNSLKILDPEVCRPFDRSRQGLNLGEGAGYVVLESSESAKRRGAIPWAAVTGYANCCDAYHQTASSPDGDGAYRAMQSALAMAGRKPSEVDYINAHGTGTANNDLSEGLALMRLFGKVPAVSSTKGLTGHTTSASGGVETVISLLAMKHSFTPVSLGFSQRMEELDFDAVRDCNTGRDINCVMVNSFGFGGNDSCCILEKVEVCK